MLIQGDEQSAYRSGHVSTGDALDGRVEVVERLALNDLRTDLATDAEAGEATLNSDEAIQKLKSRVLNEDVKSWTDRLVFLTDFLMLSMSRGRILRRLMTSALTPSLARRSAASRE